MHKAESSHSASKLSGLHTQTTSTATPVSHTLMRVHTETELQLLFALSQTFHRTTGKWHSLHLPITDKVMSHTNIRQLTKPWLLPQVIFSFDTIFADSHTYFPSLTCSQQKFIYFFFHFQKRFCALSSSKGWLSRQTLWFHLSSFLCSASTGIWQQGTSFSPRTTWLRSVTLG